MHLRILADFNTAVVQGISILLLIFSFACYFRPVCDRSNGNQIHFVLLSPRETWSTENCVNNKNLVERKNGMYIKQKPSLKMKCIKFPWDPNR